MFRSNSLRAAVALALCLPALAFAQDAKLFAKPAEYTGAHLSPLGDYVSVSTPFEERRILSIIKLSGDYSRSGIKFDAREQPVNVNWVDDHRLVVEKAKDYGYLVGSLASTGDIYASDADGTHQLQLFGYVPDSGGNKSSRLKDQANVHFIEPVEGSPGDGLFYFAPWTERASTAISAVYRVNTRTGHREQLTQFPDAVDIAMDKAGTPRFLLGRALDGTQSVRYRPQPGESEWIAAPRSLVGVEFSVLYFDPDNNHVYATISDKGEPASLYRVSLSNGTREQLATNPNYELDSWQQAGRLGPPVAVTYTSGKPKVDYLDPKSEWAQLHSGLMKAFPGQMVDFIDLTRDENKLMFYVYSDRHPGAYYLYDRTTHAPQLLFEAMEWIDPARMSPMMPIEFKNRGGQALFGYYTAPAGKTGALPLVVMPHGGPFGVEDHWGYDPDVQFLASLGYAVLQVNYRGSGQRGDTFEDSTYTQWGTGIQDDIADGVRYLIEQKLADPAKVCIYGVSFGGYSAMMNPIRNPGMYKCSIAYAGVYDMNAHFGDRDGSKQGRSWWTRSMGDEATRTAQSPALQVDKLDVPVLLIHGKTDSIVPFSQFGIAEAALKKAGKPYETLAKADEGHGFYKEANRVEAYERMKAFLLKYNPPD
ncbi:MAG: prolyl oligopeptidase family serine peptidase [Arenimonas sp.]